MSRDIPGQSFIAGFGGRSRSGKSYLSTRVAELLGLGRAGFGDYVRHRARFRGLDPSDTGHLLSLGAELVDQECESFCRNVLKEAGWTPGRSVILDGVRHVKVVETIRNIIAPQPFFLIMVVAPYDTREHRFQEEIGRSSVSLSQIDAHSTSLDETRMREMADYVVNGGEPSISSVADDIARLIRRWAAAPGKSDIPNAAAPQH